MNALRIQLARFVFRFGVLLFGPERMRKALENQRHREIEDRYHREDPGEQERPPT